MIVLHLMPASDWHALPDGQPVSNRSLLSEGFIHCTDDAQVMLRVANAFYADRPGDFVVLQIDADRLSSRCVWEQPAEIDGRVGPPLAPLFPHVYGPIEREAVLGVQALNRDPCGRFTGYGEPIRSA